MVKTNILKDDMEYIFGKFDKPELFDNKTILITGCGGFLGFYMVNFFLYIIDKGIDIKSLILLDNFMLMKPQWLKKLEQFSDRLSVNTFDICSDNLDTIKAANEADYVIHMASIASPVFYRKYPLETVEANVFGLKRLLEFYKDKELKGLLFFSSSEVYGNAQEAFIPTSEEYLGNVSCTGPRACYDEAKRFSETLCYIYANTYNMPVRIVRPFNNYGPGMKLNDGRVPADFAKCIIEKEDIVIYSDGLPTRTFCYISDAVEGYLRVLTYERGVDYFNIGNDKPEISINDLAKLFCKIGCEIMGYQYSFKYVQHEDKDYLSHNPSRRCPDISKARNLLGYEPQISLEGGIKKYIVFLLEGNTLW